MSDYTHDMVNISLKDKTVKQIPKDVQVSFENPFFQNSLREVWT